MLNDGISSHFFFISEDPLTKRPRTDMNGITGTAIASAGVAAGTLATAAAAPAVVADQTTAYSYNWSGYPQVSRSLVIRCNYAVSYCTKNCSGRLK